MVATLRAMSPSTVRMYTDLVMDHFRNPRNVGVEDPDGVGEIGNPVCGDVMRLTIKVDDGRISTSSSRPSAAEPPWRPRAWSLSW